MIHDEVVELFARGAGLILDALHDDEVVSHWNRPSVLEGQFVSGLVGHLARGGVWVVGDYLDSGSPPGPPTFSDAAAYFAHFAAAATSEAHAGVRRRGREVGSVGPDALAAQLARRIEELLPRLSMLGPDDLISVAGGAVMRVPDYLTTRIVEQTVHLDDLARSVERDRWSMPDASISLTLDVGIEIARLRRGGAAAIRAVFRDGFASEALPAL